MEFLDLAKKQGGRGENKQDTGSGPSCADCCKQPAMQNSDHSI